MNINVPTEVNVLTAKCLQDASTKTIMKRYATHLIKNENKSVSDCKLAVNKIMDVMANRGEINLVVLEEINNFIPTILQPKQLSLTHETLTALELPSEINNTELETINKYRQLVNQCESMQAQLSSSYTTLIDKQTSAIISSYSKMFSPAFTEVFKK